MRTGPDSTAASGRGNDKTIMGRDDNVSCQDFDCSSLAKELSPIHLAICNIKNKVEPNRFIHETTNTSFHNYTFGHSRTRRRIYISAEVFPDCLNQGGDMMETAYDYTQSNGVDGDQPARIIGKKLGGSGHPRNVFPMNEKLDRTQWMADENEVYEYLNQGGDRRACLVYGLQVNYFFEDEGCRDARIYYRFRLEGGNPAERKTIEGLFENTSPKMTHDQYLYPGGTWAPFGGEFKFVEWPSDEPS